MSSQEYQAGAEEQTTPAAACLSSELLFASDFDGTKFLTSEMGAGILTVSDAYAEGIDELLGTGYADTFIKDGGHQHRTPSEIIAELCPDMTPDEVESMSLHLIRAKMNLLIDQIGKPLADGAKWPRPTDGLVHLWNQISQHNSNIENAIATAEISAGHIPFIEKTYDVHGLKQPDIIVTDDFLVDELGMGEISAQERAKPSVLLLEVASTLWLNRLNIASNTEEMEAAKQHIIYTGDSDEKDGGLARNYGVEFVLLEPEHSSDNWQEIGQWLSIGECSLRGAVN